MAEIFAKWFGSGKEALYFLFRIIVGFLFFTHGAGKMFGWFGGNMISEINLFWFSGLAEVLIGAGIFFGVFVRLGALFGAIEMLVAYFMAHASKGLMPTANGGEVAVLFFAAFLVFLAFGARSLSLERGITKNEIF